MCWPLSDRQWKGRECLDLSQFKVTSYRTVQSSGRICCTARMFAWLPIPCSALHSSTTTLKTTSNGWGDGRKSREAPSLILTSPIKGQAWCYTLVTPVLGGRGRGLPGADWPASLAEPDETHAQLETLSPEQRGQEEGDRKEHDKI